MSVFSATDYDDHEEVCFFRDPGSGLRAIIAIHVSRGGVAGGGVRMWPYDDEQKAVTDALRLSRAMTSKFALAGIAIGGAKTVIIGDPRRDKSPELLRALGRAVESLGGRYICGPDVGTTPEDMAVIASVTAHARGRPGESGDTSPATGYGVFVAMTAAAEHKWGRKDLSGLRVAVQGVGGVGYALCRHLHEAGARILVSDVDPGAVARAVAAFDAVAVDPGEILAVECDILAPCALGAVLDDETIPAIAAGIVCGGANNQLAEARHGADLARRGILYVPDYVANAGGAINAVREGPDYDAEEAGRAVAGIRETCLAVFRRAEADGIPTNMAADRMAAEIVGRK